MTLWNLQSLSYLFIYMRTCNCTIQAIFEIRKLQRTLEIQKILVKSNRNKKWSWESEEKIIPGEFWSKQPDSSSALRQRHFLCLFDFNWGNVWNFRDFRIFCQFLKEVVVWNFWLIFYNFITLVCQFKSSGMSQMKGIPASITYAWRSSVFTFFFIKNSMT